VAILSSIPVLNCQSMEATLSFYQQLLQFVVIKKSELQGRLSWVHIMHGNTALMLQAAEEKNANTSPVRRSGITLYFFVDNINELHHFIKLKYTDVSDIKMTHYHMQEFSLIDPEGNNITVAQKS